MPVQYVCMYVYMWASENISFKCMKTINALCWRINYTYAYACVRACIHIYIHTYIHAFIWRQERTALKDKLYIRICMCTCMCTRIHTYIHAFIWRQERTALKDKLRDAEDKCANAESMYAELQQVCMLNTLILKHSHIYRHKHTHVLNTHTRIDTNLHTHTHTQIDSICTYCKCRLFVCRAAAGMYAHVTYTYA